MQKFAKTLLTLAALAMAAASVGCAHDTYGARSYGTNGSGFRNDGAAGSGNDTNNAKSSYGDGPMGEP